jgi:hypothetical protein
LLYEGRLARALIDVPRPIRRPPDRYVRLGATAVITGYRHIAAFAPLRGDGLAVAALYDVPVAGRGTKDCNIRLAVAIEVSIDWLIGRHASTSWRRSRRCYFG